MVGITDVASLAEVLSPYAVLVVDRSTRTKLPEETSRLLAEKSLWVYEFSDDCYLGDWDVRPSTNTTDVQKAPGDLVVH